MNLSWILAIAVFLLGIVVLYNNKRIAKEMINGWKAASGANRARMVRSVIFVLRCGAIGLGIGLILVAITLVIGGPIEL